jgi:hypothetical protein
MKKIIFLSILIFGFNILQAESVMAKAYQKRVEILSYLRILEPIVKNYRGLDREGKPTLVTAEKGKEGERHRKYIEVKRLFQEGLADYFEGDYSNSYKRFLEAQVDIEQLFEELSEFYIETSSEILKSAVFMKDPNDYADPAFDSKVKDKKLGDVMKETDQELVDISVEFGAKSRNLRDMTQDREAPYLSRQYNPKETHFLYDKYAIEQNIETGYRALGEAKQARIDALKIERNFEKHQKLQPVHRKYRIEKYIAVIERCRLAKTAAVSVFQLKYPYDNYYLQKNDKTTLGKIIQDNGKGEDVSLTNGKSMNYSINPYVNPKHINPVFDRRIPEKYRRDAADVIGLVYDEELEKNINLKYTDLNSVNLNLKRQLIDEELKVEEGAGGSKSESSSKSTPAKQ